MLCCKRKMLERNWSWRNNWLFCHIFVIGEISIGGGPCPPLLAYTYAPTEENEKGVRKFSARFLAFLKRNFNCSKTSAVLEPRTGQFSRTWGFEAKAKDFKMCPRGQGRPRGLHLWLEWILSTFPVTSCDQANFDKNTLFRLNWGWRNQIECI